MNGLVIEGARRGEIMAFPADVFRSLDLVSVHLGPVGGSMRSEQILVPVWTRYYSGRYWLNGITYGFWMLRPATREDEPWIKQSFSECGREKLMSARAWIDESAINV